MPAKKTKDTKKNTTKKTVAKKTTTKKAVAKKAPVKKTAAKKSVTKKTANKATKKTAKKPTTSKKIAVKAPAVKKTTKQVTKAIVWDSFFTPLDNRLVVEVEVKSSKTTGGIYIPDTVVAATPNSGVVLAAGRGHRSEKGLVQPMDVKVGDKILFSEHSGSKLNISDQDVLMLREQDILGVVE